MNIEIWSDFICPFCYIGKRKFEIALEKFPHREQVKITWRSFELSPGTLPKPGQDVYDYLAERKGQSREWAVQAHVHVTQLAKAVGLDYNFDKAVVANTFDAHRLSHLAAQHGLQDKMEERLFRAYFTEGKNIGDHGTLAMLGTETGLDAAEIHTMLSSLAFADEVRKDEEEAQQIGARGVPFFVMERRFGVSGAQDPEVFLQTLEKAWAEKGK